MNQIEQAQELMTWAVNEQTNDQINHIVENGFAFWRLDPDVDGVVGVVCTDSPMQAVVIFFLEEKDFEFDEELLEHLLAKKPEPKRLPRTRRR